MAKYDVHIYAIARLKVAGIEADSPQDAVRKAEQQVDLYHAIANGEAEYAEDIEGFLVDVVNEAREQIEGQEGQSVFFNLKEDVT